MKAIAFVKLSSGARKALLGGVVLGACVASSAGCAAELDAEPAPVYVTAQTVPVDIETYPSVTYEGHATYYVEGRWYYRNGSSWAYYRTEPRELGRRRASLPQRREAPRADDGRRIEAPPARRE